MVEHLCQAVNDHDLDARVACFAPDYVNGRPAHPARGFPSQHKWRRFSLRQESCKREGRG